MNKLYKVISNRTQGVTAELVGHFVEYLGGYPGNTEKVYVKFKTGPYGNGYGGRWWFYKSDLQEVTPLNRPERKKNTLTIDTINDLCLTYARPNPEEWRINTEVTLRPRARRMITDWTIDF